MNIIRIKHVDAFTETPFSGNPAGVVLDAKNLSESQMAAIAREMNLSETAFILPPSKLDADIRIRWFTPTVEVPLCGHATVASFHALAEEGKMGIEKNGEYHFRMETTAGILPLDITKEGDSITVMLGMKLPSLQSGTQQKIELVRLLNITQGEFDGAFPALRDKYLFVAVKRLHTLFTMKPNFVMMSYFLESRNLHGLCVFTTETVDRESKIHSRFFAPNDGINEDPVTGSSHAPLAVILYQNGIIKAQDGKCVFQGEQGDAIGRRGRVMVELSVDGEKPVSVKVGGKAVTIFEGDLKLNE
jgi:trans-2,3-dihydro-3-hydroxyanthranilate isomerase